jgi:hypothetical protein
MRSLSQVSVRLEISTRLIGAGGGEKAAQIFQRKIYFIFRKTFFRYQFQTFLQDFNSFSISTDLSTPPPFPPTQFAVEFILK